MIRRPPRSTLSSSSAASDVYKRQHRAPGLAEALGMRAPEVPADVLFDGLPLAVTHDHAAPAADRAERGKDRLVIAKDPGKEPRAATRPRSPARRSRRQGPPQWRGRAA